MSELFAEIADLHDQLDAAERDALLLVEDLPEAQGCWRPGPDSWSVAQCLDHIAVTNQVYLGAMKEAAMRAREAGRFRQRPALPGRVGRWFAANLEPPVKAFFKVKAPRNIKPGNSPSLMDALATFLKSQDEVRAYLRANSDLDLADIRFANPLLRGIRFSLATGLHVITAHERRHLWQAWGVRRAASLSGHAPASLA
ncbi:hypothetical protein Terro_4177 [Terriglobus roseus DSM 18391]|uniref:DinB-like domain-containing protein n=1 Tax=Terriglobus roseus (strain DSM 18391 / NRRL B-41598 / KBS 63) TaxID=926566 RepID=I3ZMB4_TERRK|nr:DinB family protein [Terriglobus roseus]AFL90382.1 hypothetical protein Terro_4177 [Terriglobus roseus DSM 18391]